MQSEIEQINTKTPSNTNLRKCLRKSDIEKILGVKRTTRVRITRLPDFPKSFKLWGTIEVWDSEEVYQWLEKQKAEHGDN